MQIKDIVSRIRNSSKEVTGDSVLRNRHIYNAFYTNALLLLEKDKRNLTKQENFKTVSLETEEVNLLENSCVPLDCMGCRVKLPKITSNKNGLVYRYISSPDKSILYKLTTPLSFQRKTKIKNNLQKYAFVDGDYLYLSECLPCIEISYLPDAMDDTGICKILEEDVPFPDYLIDMAIKNALTELGIFIQKSQDHTTNKSTLN